MSKKKKHKKDKMSTKSMVVQAIIDILVGIILLTVDKLLE